MRPGYMHGMYEDARARAAAYRYGHATEPRAPGVHGPGMMPRYMHLPHLEGGIEADLRMGRYYDLDADRALPWTRPTGPGESRSRASIVELDESEPASTPRGRAHVFRPTTPPAQSGLTERERMKSLLRGLSPDSLVRSGLPLPPLLNRNMNGNISSNANGSSNGNSNGNSDSILNSDSNGDLNSNSNGIDSKQRRAGTEAHSDNGNSTSTSTSKKRKAEPEPESELESDQENGNSTSTSNSKKCKAKKRKAEVEADADADDSASSSTETGI